MAIKGLGPCLVQLYGQGESPMTITYLPRQDHVLDGNADQMRRLASAGYAHVNVEVKVFDADDNELPAGETGEIVTRSDLVMKGYWRDPGATAETLRNGWLHTGDLGTMDEHGYVFIMDRLKDMIVSGGVNIYPREVEIVLEKHQDIRDCTVFGIPDEKWGEALCALIVSDENRQIGEADILAHCTDHLAKFKQPKVIRFVDSIPKTPAGKVQKPLLREAFIKENGLG